MSLFSFCQLDALISFNFNFYNGDTGEKVSKCALQYEDVIEKVLQVWKKRQDKKPTEKLEEKIKALELAKERYKDQLEQLKDADPDMIVDSVDVVFNRELTEEERALLNSKEVTEKQLTDLITEYDPDCMWTDAEWKYDRFINNFDEEGIDARSAIIFGYAVNDLFEELKIPDLFVERVEVDKSVTGEAAAEYLRQKFGFKK